MKRRGFSLLEVLMASLILSMLLLNISSIGYKYNLVQIESLASELRSAIQYAKFMAIIREERLILQCMDFEDCTRGLRLYSLNNSKLLIREWSWPRNKHKIIWRGIQSDKYLIFAADIRQNILNGKFVLYKGQDALISLVVNRLGLITECRSGICK